MTRSELIERLSARFPQLARHDAVFVVKIILEAISAALASGNRIEIRGFGSFGLHFRPARIGRNPKSGKYVAVPDRHVPYFRTGKELRARVNMPD